MNFVTYVAGKVEKNKKWALLICVGLIFLGGLFFWNMQDASAAPKKSNKCHSNPRKCGGDSSIPAGCPGGPAGPQAPGTKCPNSPGGKKPERKDCDKAKKPAQCKKQYDRCDRHTTAAKKTNCKKKVLERHSASGGGSGSAGGGGGGSGGLSDEEKKQGYRDVCGKGKSRVPVKFDIGCIGDQLPNNFKNPIYDMAFALIRFLSAGVGIVVIIVIIMAGIKYSTSEGNPEATAQAKNSIQSALIALLLYIFAFAIINYLVPGGLLSL